MYIPSRQADTVAVSKSSVTEGAVESFLNNSLKYLFWIAKIKFKERNKNVTLTFWTQVLSNNHDLCPESHKNYKKNLNILSTSFSRTITICTQNPQNFNQKLSGMLKHPGHKFSRTITVCVQNVLTFAIPKN